MQLNHLLPLSLSSWPGSGAAEVSVARGQMKKAKTLIKSAANKDKSRFSVDFKFTYTVVWFQVKLCFDTRQELV